jgi:hypothetical protein
MPSRGCLVRLVLAVVRSEGDLLAFGGDGDPPPSWAWAPGIMPAVVGGLDLIPEVTGPSLVHRTGVGVGLVDEVGPGLGKGVNKPQPGVGVRECSAGT